MINGGLGRRLCRARVRFLKVSVSKTAFGRCSAFRDERLRVATDVSRSIGASAACTDTTDRIPRANKTENRRNFVRDWSVCARARHNPQYTVRLDGPSTRRRFRITRTRWESFMEYSSLVTTNRSRLRANIA